MRKSLLVAGLAVWSLPALGGAVADEQEIKKEMTAFAASWNTHDAKAMASFWATDGDLINPSGRVAKGRAEVEKLFADEHSTVMKGTSYAVLSTSFRMVKPDLTLADADAEITGMKAPDGRALPTFKHHVTSLWAKQAGRWRIVAARPYAFLPPPPPAK